MVRIIKVKNNTGSSKNWVGQIIDAGEYHPIEENQISKWAENSDVFDDIGSGDLVISQGAVDGYGDISDSVDAWNWLTGNLGKYNVSGETIVDVGLRKGPIGTESITLVTHDFSDRTTWYQNSTRLTDQALSHVSGGQIFEAPGGKRNWINIHGSKLTLDYNKIPMPDGTLVNYDDFELIVKIDGTPQDTSTYSVDCEAGQIIFASGDYTANAVTATYNHNDGVTNPSDFIVTPQSGHILRIEHVEIQFSKDTVFNSSLTFEGWAGANLATYSDFNNALFDAGYGQSRSEYRGVRDLINWCNNQYPVIPAPGQDGLTKDILVFPFHFLYPLELKSSLGVLMRMTLGGDTPISTELATATFYMEKSQE